MSDPTGAAYTFLPWVRRGLARSIAEPDTPSARLAATATLSVSLRVEGAGEVTTPVRLYGPGDVTGLDRRQIVRTEPRPGTTSFESTYLPSIVFARAELPWLFTPAAPDGARLRPWLVLIVVRRQPGVRLDPRPGGPLPVLEIGTPANAADELPDLSQSWAWAHAQIAGLQAGQSVDQLLDAVSGRASSRLLCPRRLAPSTSYVACVVPAFASGVSAGLGMGPAADEADLAPAWTPATTAVQLPVYLSWEFATGASGSFETLVGRLQPRPLAPDATRAPALDISRGGSGLPSFDPATPGAVVGMQSALRAPGADAAPDWPQSTRAPFQETLAHLIDESGENTISAPLYGQVQAGGGRLANERTPAWLREINLDPRLRVAAAVGTRVVQDRQEDLMARAWTQAGAAADANAILRRAQLARELGNALVERHVQRFSAPELLAITQPVHARAELSGRSVDDELRASRIPAAAVSGALRRLASPQGILARRAQPGATRRAPVDVLPALDRMAAAPPPAAPAGMVAATMAFAPPPAAAMRPALSAVSVQTRLMARLKPEATVLARAQARIAAPAGTWTRPDPLSPVAVAPTFPEPMYEALQEVAPWLLLPGLGRVDADSIALLEISPSVIEAYMVGLNHEMGRELLWREFPADLTATFFRQFWDARGQTVAPASLEDIAPLASWGDTPLGSHLRGAGAVLVLLVRGELLRRYPATVVYAARSRDDGTLDAATRRAPMFRGAVDPDVAFVGFALSEDEALGRDPAGPGWYFAFEEYPGEPRFGLDEFGGPQPATSPDDLAWSSVSLSRSGHIDLSGPLLHADPALQADWARDAAGMARLVFQQPFRVAMHASRLIVRAEVRP